MKIIISISLAFVVLFTMQAYSQLPEDALRLSTPNLGIGARSLGMGTAYTGIASDFSAMYTNPAGLGQIRLNEFSFGLSNLSYNNSADYLSNNTSFSNSATDINNVGLVYPFPVSKGSLVLAVGYGRNADYTTALSYKGFNPTNTMISWLPDVQMAYNLYLTDTLGRKPNGSIYTPYVDSLQQDGKVLEGGGTNNWTVAGAVEAANNLYLGLALNFISGSYTYSQNYNETDTQNKYSVARYGDQQAFSGFNIQNTINDDVGGFSARFGFLYKINPKARVGFSVKTPTWYSINETYSSDGTSTFRVPDTTGNNSYNDRTDNKIQYDVTTPFVFSGGFAYSLGDLLLSLDADYTDWTQMSFSNGDPSLDLTNTDIKSIFRSTTNLRLGGEYEFPGTGFRIRGGYAYLPSPYQSDINGADQKYVTAGVGFIVENAVSIDIGYARGTWNTSHIAYDNAPVTSEKITTNSILATILYRY